MDGNANVVAEVRSESRIRETGEEKSIRFLSPSSVYTVWTERCEEVKSLRSEKTYGKLSFRFSASESEVVALPPLCSRSSLSRLPSPAAIVASPGSSVDLRAQDRGKPLIRLEYTRLGPFRLRLELTSLAQRGQRFLLLLAEESK